VASQYFALFVTPGSAGSTYNPISFYNLLWKFNQKPYGVEETGFETPEDFQKTLWWYDALPQYMAMPPVFAGSLANLFPPFFIKPNPGHAQEVQAGKVNVPTLYGCGNEDSSIKCNHPYALATKDYVTKDYTYLEANCGHQMLSPSNTDLKKVTDGIISHIVKHSPS